MYLRLSPVYRRHRGWLLLLPSAQEETRRQLPQHLTTASSSFLSRLSHSLRSQDDNFPDTRLGFVCRELEGIQSMRPIIDTQEECPGGGEERRQGERRAVEVEISHRWPEWVELMEKLLQGGYLDRYGLQRGTPTVSKDANRIRTACLNFARERPDLIRYLSRKDIQIIVGSGCPSSDRKVANSGKRLRAHVGIEEGKVCSSCNLRGNCERAYLSAHKEERGRTLDVMRFLLTYGLDFAIGSSENQSHLTRTIEGSVRRLLHETVEFGIKEVRSNSEHMTSGSGGFPTKTEKLHRKQLPSQIDVLMKQGDWICPKCNFLNFAKNIKCLRCNGVSQEKLKKLNEEYAHLPLKKGDWICDKCNFLNFAKNPKCLQCNEKPTKRQLNPGEWECASCGYINFRRNAVCLKCDWKRPKASNSEASQSAYQPEGHHRSSRISFVRNENDNNVKYPQHLGRAEEDSGFWSSSSDEDDDDTAYMPTSFKDFQIAGGRGVISQDPLEKEREQVDAPKTRAVLKKQVKKGVSTMDSVRCRISEFDDTCSDDEMAGWFGCGKKDKKGL